MKLLVANIGGSKAYKNVLQHLNEVKEALKLPDAAAISEPGDDSKFKGLEPYFTKFETLNKLRLHFKKEEMNIETWRDDEYDIFVINYMKLPSDHKWALCKKVG